jgi:hypothetical protein
MQVQKYEIENSWSKDNKNVSILESF